jgi:hypothetical protein
VALLVLSPVVVLELDFLLAPAPTLEQFLAQARFDLKELVPPLSFALAGYAIGSVVRAVIKRTPTTA